jgi:predicted transcriptional regulator YdeE
MKVMVMVKASKQSEAGEMPSTELLTAMMKFNEQVAAAGIMVDAAGLTPSSNGARVRFSGANRTVIDGPFAETKELIAGFWIWQVKSLAEAIEWVKKCPNPMLEDSDIEIRPFFEAADFGEAMTPELREQEAAIRATSLGLNAPTYRTVSAQVIAGINRSYDMETRSGIPKQWDEFVSQVHRLNSRKVDVFYGVSWNSTPDFHFDYLTGIEVNSDAKIPPDFTTVTLPSRRYAVFAHTEHVTAIPKTIETIFTKWARDCGLKIAKAPCFERYTSDFNPQTGMGGTDIWIPLD